MLKQGSWYFDTLIMPNNISDNSHWYVYLKKHKWNSLYLSGRKPATPLYLQHHHVVSMIILGIKEPKRIFKPWETPFPHFLLYFYEIISESRFSYFGLTLDFNYCHKEKGALLSHPVPLEYLPFSSLLHMVKYQVLNQKFCGVTEISCFNFNWIGKNLKFEHGDESQW